MVIYFITGNSGKLGEAKSVIPEIEQIDLNLPEIQELDAKKIIEEKLNSAINENKGSFFCEDTSVYIDSLGGLPGPLIKWFLQALGDKGIAELVERYENKSATAKTFLGYIGEDKKILFFEGKVRGKIVAPRGDGGFGWDKIFQPEGYEKTFGEMTLAEKEETSMRKQALIKLKEFLGK